MMHRAALILLSIGLTASAAHCEWRCFCLTKWYHCPDDYCKKPLPPIPGNQIGCVNDYCKKPLPGFPCNVGPGCIHDYCKKPPPPCPSIGSGPSYTCGSCLAYP
jgi:hypothetical protein